MTSVRDLPDACAASAAPDDVAASGHPDEVRTPDEQHAPQAAAWRLEVGRLRAAEQRRRHPLCVWVGAPDGPREGFELSFPEPSWHDSGLRAELLSTLLTRLESSLPAPQEPSTATPGLSACWLTRPGVPRLHDADLQWYAAARWAFAAHGLIMSRFIAVTRRGWLDVGSGEHREWKRLRVNR